MSNQTIDPRKKIPLDLNTVLTIEKVVYDEAGNQGRMGRDAVRAVIYNRVAAGLGGNDVLSVLNAKNQFQGVWEKARGDARRLSLPEKMQEALMSEHMDFLRKGQDPTGGATFFLNKAIAKKPFNVKHKGLKIGDHEFFNHYNGRKVEVPQYEVALRGGQRIKGGGEGPSTSRSSDDSFLGKVKKYVGELLPLGDSKPDDGKTPAQSAEATNTPRTFGPLTSTPVKATGSSAQKYEGDILPLRQGGYVKAADGGVIENLKTAAGIAADFTPVVGEIKSGYEAYDAYKKGNYGEAALSAAGALPLVGGVVRGARKAGKAAEAGESVFKALTSKGTDAAAKETTKAAKEAGQALAKVEPTQTVKAYKLFRINKDRPGELFPLFVNADKGVPVNKWVDADVGPLTQKGQVKSKIGDLAYRPGWHAGDNAAATHIGGKSTPDLKKPDYRPADQVWAEVELPADVDWQSVANARASVVKSGPNKGQINAKEAHITDQVPEGGHYRYKTNPNMQGEWLIGGSMRVNKTLDPVELSRVHKETGVPDLPSLPEVIDQKGLKLDDLNKEAVKELKTFYPDKFDELSNGLGLNAGGLLGRKYIEPSEDTEPDEDVWIYVSENPDNYVGSNYERGDMKAKMNCGGIMAPEMMDMEVGEDPVSGNPIPPGSLPSEVRDDIPAMLSEGEFVLPADVVRWHGLKHIMEMRAEAKMGLMSMSAEGLLHEGEPVEPEEIEEDEETETPEGNKVTKASPKIEEEGMELEEDEEGKDYAKMLEEPYGDERVIVLMKSDPSVFRKS